ncbi:unnamed protein product [Somion occarium]|uniref:Uncharacterized protein n=1 Tax=Somion occarium TaxID=3059160 RepID=A0ABP1E683_9APHY
MQPTLHQFLHGTRDESSPDELDLLTPTSSNTLVGSPFPDEQFDASKTRRSLRPRISTASEPTPKKKNKKRKQAQLKLVADEEPEGKRIKLAHTIVINKKRVSIDAARRRWLHRHRHLFMPLLPESSSFFENLEREVGNSTDEGVYVPMHQLDEQPLLIKGGQMKDYQLQGLSFLTWMHRNGMNCILGDEMGLGKTLQTLSLFAHIKEETTDPHLIICPLSVLSSWNNEIAHWVPSLRVIQFHGQVAERARLKAEIHNAGRFDICLTTYEQYVTEQSWFKSRRWTYVVLDEGHKIKNWETDIARSIQGIGALHRLILTGTPVQNNLIELWGLLHFLYPTLFTPATLRGFRDSFDMTRGSYATDFLNGAHDLLNVIMLRRTKANVVLNVPPREETTMFIPMSEAQRFWYYRLLMRMDSAEMMRVFNGKDEQTESSSVLDVEKTVGAEEGQGHDRKQLVKEYIQSRVEESKGSEGNSWKKLMNLLMQLRKVCDHPYMLPNAEPTPYSIGEHVVASSSKLIFLDKLLKDILPKGERVLIFSQWTSMLDLLEDFMALRDIPYARLDGSTTRPRRTLDIKLFQQEKSPYKVFLVSTKAGGLGINLTKASTVIMFDSDWNPQNDLQAIARAHRIGQTKVVKVYRLIVQGSVEDQMLDRLRRKLFLSLKIMGGSDNTLASSNSNSGSDTGPQLGLSELMSILRRGSSALATGDGGADATGFMNLSEFLDAPIENILQLSKERESARMMKMKVDMGEDSLDTTGEADATKNKEELLRSAEEEERRLLSGVAQVHSRLFEGKIINRSLPSNSQIASEWQEVQKKAKRAGQVTADADGANEHVVEVDGRKIEAALIGPEAHVPVVVMQSASTPLKTKKKKFDHEDWCIYCRDGGELVLCSHCPRVFHADCHGVTKKEVAKASFITCSQHVCTTCGRSTTDAGGMLFRCQTCPQGFCEDCLPFGDIEAVGATLPELLLVGYGEKASAYYIRCHDCLKLFAEQPKIWKSWQKDMRETEKRLNQLDML